MTRTYFQRRSTSAVLYLSAMFLAVIGHGEESKPAKPADSAVQKLLKTIAEKDRITFGAATLRELVNLGPKAVPELIDELDTTQDEWMLRNLGFVLRAIGDKRAVPALIRAIPKTCQPPASDYGSRLDDAELMAFMRKHDVDENDLDPDNFHFGRPVTEINFALQKLTGKKLGENDLLFVFLQGNDNQQKIQRRQFQQIAERWTEWWEKHWKDHVDDKAYSHVNLYVRRDLMSAAVFPHGPEAKFGEPMDGMILQSPRSPRSKWQNDFGKPVFFDLDTGRMSDIPESLQSKVGDPERLDEISAWAAREGFDVMGAEYTPPGKDKPHYVIRGLGLTAWELDTTLWDSIQEELKKPELPALGKPAAGLLAHFDEGTGRFNPVPCVAFLIITREGTHGALFVGAEITDTDVVLGVPSPGPREIERSNVGLYLGRRISFQAVEGPTK